MRSTHPRSRIPHRRRTIAVALAAAACTLALQACGNDDGGPVPGGGGPDAGPCTPLPTTYSAVHDQVLATDTCARSGCHDTATVQQGGSNALDLSGGKAAVYAMLLDAPTNATDVVGMMPHRVVAGDPTNSFLWRKVKDDDPPGFGSRMPLGCSPRFPLVCLTTCQLDALEGWIAAGAKDD